MNRKWITLFVSAGVIALLSACNSDNTAHTAPAQGDAFMAAVQQMTATTLDESEPADVEALVPGEADEAAEPAS